MLRGKAIQYLVALTLLILFFFIGYKVHRYETVRLLVLYSLAFAMYLWVIERAPAGNLNFWILCSVIFRFILLFSVPNLSDDFYRFIWDGRLLASGHHPFAHLPSYYIENKVAIPGIDEVLFSQLNSKEYFTIYPPVAQFLFWLSAKLSWSVYGSVIVLKSFNLVAEIGSIIILKKLLNQFGLPIRKVLIYALNPLIILELIGNAHFEAIMIFFILLSIYFMRKNRVTLAAISMGFSIGVKLIPLIFLPAVKKLSGSLIALKFSAIALTACALFSMPLLNEQMLTGFQNSLQYFLAKFEFNASVYYLIREIGYAAFGHNVIYFAGPVLALVALLLIIKLSFKGVPKLFLDPLITNSEKKPDNLLLYIHTLAGCLLIYYLFTTTLHPWYISTLFVLSIFTSFRFTILWTYMIFLTYAGYSIDGFDENLWIVSLEYITVFGFFAFELWKKQSLILTISKA